MCILPLLTLFPTLKINVIQIYIPAVCRLKRMIDNDLPKKYLNWMYFQMQNAFDNLLQGHFKLKQKKSFLIKICIYFFQYQFKFIKENVTRLACQFVDYIV